MTYLQGWRLTGVMALLVAALALGVIAVHGVGSDALRLIIRITARTSLVLFSLAFTASALLRWRSTAWTRWQMKNRRYLGVSFAASHGMHLAAIVAYAALYPEIFKANISMLGIVGGGLGYVFIIAMTATSFDGAAAWLGARKWKTLHTAGSYYIWFIFGFTFLPRTSADALYWVFMALVIAVFAIRMIDLFTRRKPAAA